MFPDLSISPSPNWNDRPINEDGQVIIDTVVLHYTGMQSADAALVRMCSKEAKVSAHYMVEEGGNAHELVSPDRRAWHAGVSMWQGRGNLNHTSIGIELVNPGHEFGYKPFPDAQIESLLHLLKYLKQTYDIPRHRFIGHSDIAPDRKQDPGELFPWSRLASMGFGIWPVEDTSDQEVVVKVGSRSPEIASLNKHLSIIGYNIENNDVQTHIPEGILTAFQRHWRQSAVNGLIDRGTLIAAKSIAALTQQSQNT